MKGEADIVAIPINSKNIKELENSYFQGHSYIPYCINDIPESDIKEYPSKKVEVIGFPYGFNVSEYTNEYSPIWTSGFIASEPEINYEGKPVFLIDSRTREGNSGSPVFIMNEHNNNFEYKFLGIYSGRISKESDIGKVWKKQAIIELLNYVDFLIAKNKINDPFIDFPVQYETFIGL